MAERGTVSPRKQEKGGVFHYFHRKHNMGVLLTALGESFAALVRQHSVSPSAFVLAISQESFRKGFVTLCSKR